MFEIKQQVFLNLTKRQKSALCSSLKNFVKLHQADDEATVLNKFIDEEQYYNDIDNPHLYFVVENISDEKFMRDLKLFINAVFYDIEQKKKMKPFLDKQKELARQERKRAAEYKMKHEKPTPKQLKYYKNLCKNHNLEPENLENSSKFDLKNKISEILDKYAK